MENQNLIQLKNKLLEFIQEENKSEAVDIIYRIYSIGYSEGFVENETLPF